VLILWASLSQNICFPTTTIYNCFHVSSSIGNSGISELAVNIAYQMNQLFWIQMIKKYGKQDFHAQDQ